MVLLVITVMMAGCFGFIDPKVQEAMDKGDPELCKEVEREYDRENCYRQVAVSTGREDFCDDYYKEGSAEIDRCFADVGSKTGSLATCDRAGDERKQMECYANIGRNTDNPAVCGKIRGQESLRDSCFSDVAISLNKPEYCEQVDTELSVRDSCFKTLSVKNQDQSMCEKVREGPRDDCYFQVADKKGTEEICEKIEDKGQRSKCWSKVTGDPSICEDLEKGLSRDSCIQSSAEKGGSAKDCKKIEEPSLRDSCIRAIVKNSGNPSDCDGVSKHYIQDCKKSAAVASGDTSKCSVLSERSQQTICTKEIAYESLKLEDCEAIPVGRQVDECRIEQTKQRKQKGLADKAFGEKVVTFWEISLRTGRHFLGTVIRPRMNQV